MSRRSLPAAAPAVAFLVSARGKEALDAARATRDRPPMARRKELERRGVTGAEARAALAEDDLRVKAAAKTPDAEELLFTRDALEQATPHEVATERAARFASFGTVADLGAGIGLDAIALARAGRRVVAVERDPVRAALLRHNAIALGLGDSIEVCEGDFLVDPPEAEAAFLDPDRRPGGVRRRLASEFEPPAKVWGVISKRYQALLVKLPPVPEPDPAAGSGFEWVSLDGRMKEARTGWGALAIPVPRRATILHRGAPSAEFGACGGECVEGTGRPWPPARAPRVGDVLLDPDPAVVVAGLVGDAAESVGAAPIHPRIAYLLAAAPAAWASSLRVEAILAADPRAIRKALDARGAGDLEIRSRGVSDPPDVWRRRIGPLRGDRGKRATVVLARGPDERYLAVLSSPMPVEGGGMGLGPDGMP